MMAEQTQQEPKTTKRTKKHVRLATIVVVITVVIACFIWCLWSSRSVDERLAEIEAARAIPDSENAATIYNQLLQDPNATSLFDYRPEFLDEKSYNQTLQSPWLSKDYPELAQWLKEQQPVIDKLLLASRFEKCRFPIGNFPEGFDKRIDLLSAMRQWTYLLVRAANNDLGEGRIDSALEKYFSTTQMADHFYQQPLMIDFLVGMAMEGRASGRIRSFIVEGPSIEEHLRAIETALPPTKNLWNDYSQKMLKVEQLYVKSQPNFFLRMKYLWRNIEDSPEFNRIHELYLRLLSDRRGNLILIALKRYKNKTGRWPEMLDEIKSSLPAEVLTDPQNGGPFVYKLTDDSFKLYSKGKNNIDENGKWRPLTGDDWPIWPPRGRKPKTNEENADPNQPDTSTEPAQ